MEGIHLGGSGDTAIAILVGSSAFLSALTVGVLLTPWMKKISWRFGAVDKPDGHLKCHSRPTATLGGIPLALSVFAGLSLLIALSIGFDREAIRAFYVNVSWGGVLVAGFVIMLMGVTDDIRQIKPRTKLLFQLLASAVLIGSGLVIHHVDFFGIFDFNLSGLAVPFTLFWLVGSCNALNFIDGMDGLASGIGLILSLVLAAVGMISGHYGAAVIALALAGGLIAILLYNLKPAQIFLGDSGSQLVGLILGALSVSILTNHNGHFTLPAAGLLMSVPVIDAFLCIVRRYGQDMSPACGDRRHLHHCLQRLGLGIYPTLMIVWTLVLLSAMIGMACRFRTGSTITTLAILFVTLELYLGVRLGCLDISRLVQRLASQFRWSSAYGERLHIKRVAELQALWEAMKPHFEQMRLDRAMLTLEAMGADGRPMYETYQWQRDAQHPEAIGLNHWTRRFSLDADASRIATLRLEAAEKLRQDEKRFNWLLNQIRSNMEYVNRQRRLEEQISAMPETELLTNLTTRN